MVWQLGDRGWHLIGWDDSRHSALSLSSAARCTPWFCLAVCMPAPWGRCWECHIKETDVVSNSQDHIFGGED